MVLSKMDRLERGVDDAYYEYRAVVIRFVAVCLSEWSARGPLALSYPTYCCIITAKHTSNVTAVKNEFIYLICVRLALNLHIKRT